MTPAVPARANGAGNGVQRAARAGGVPSEGGGRARWDGAKVGVSEIIPLCRPCHDCVHEHLEQELADEYYTLEKLLEHPRVHAFAKWASSQRARRVEDGHNPAMRYKR